MAKRCFLVYESGSIHNESEAIPCASLADARRDFSDTARELGRFGQAISASVHIAETHADAAEYPNFILSVGPRGGVLVEKC